MIKVGPQVFSNVHVLCVAMQRLVGMIHRLLLHLIQHVSLFHVGFRVRHVSGNLWQYCSVRQIITLYNTGLPSYFELHLSYLSWVLKLSLTVNVCVCVCMCV